MTRRCSRCRLEKPTTEFYRRAEGRGYKSRCKDCCWEIDQQNRDRINERNRRRRQREPERVRAAGRSNQARFRAWLNAPKDRPCADCGRQYPPYVMDFDHRDRTQKRFSVGRGWEHSIQALLAEIAKCELVCANCHRERTFSRKDHGRPRLSELGASAAASVRGTVQLLFTFEG